MKTQRWYTVGLIVLLLLMSFAPTASAASTVVGSMTLFYPDWSLTGSGLKSCEPWEDASANSITVVGPVGAIVVATFAWSVPFSGPPNYLPPITHSILDDGDGDSIGKVVIPVSYPMDSTLWPLWDHVTNERAIAVAAFVRVTANGTTTKLVSKQWWVRCPADPTPAQGCTPGYWRQDQHLDSWVATGYASGDDFEAVFGVDASFSPHALIDAVWLGGGGEFALARHAVAALLNSSHPDVDYPYSTAEVITGVQNAYAAGDFEPFKDMLEFANESSCPLN